jgi:two-component system OmpR family response regulator
MKGLYTMSQTILVIEDEIPIAELLEMELTHEGYEVTLAVTGTEGLAKALELHWDIILLDIMLPGISGLEVLRRFRHAGSQTPVILITARGSTPDKVSGLDLGANDYISKPFEMEELLARIRVWIRRGKVEFTEETLTNSTIDTKSLILGELSINPLAREVLRRHTHIDLTAREFDLLYYLMENRNQVLSRDQIIQNVWGYDFMGDTNVVDVYIRYLRKKIDYPFDQQYIKTYRGIGYSVKEFEG